MSKRIYLDTETTGLDPKKNAIIELAAIIEIDGKEVHNFSWNIKPTKGKIIDPDALVVTGITKEQIDTFQSSKAIYNQFVSLMDKYVNKYDSNDKFYFYAYNAPFDRDFVLEWFRDNKNPYLFSYAHWPWISVDVLAAIYAENQRDKFANFKLGTVAKSLGIEVDEEKLHGGLYDVVLMKQIYEILEKEFNI